MKILITGGAGFIGSNFILYWMKNHTKDELYNFDKLTYAGNLENLKEVEKNPNYHFVKGDICDGNLVDKVMEGVDIVVHFAAESHVDRSISGPSIFIETNVVGTYTLLKSASKHKIKRFHHISTDEVFGSLDLNDKKKFSEETNYNPRSPYAASKASSDHIVRAFYHTYGLPISITNCSNNFGPFQHPEKLISLAITHLLEEKKIPVYGDGLNIRDWLYVEDHCRAIEMVLESKEGVTYCVGGMEEDISNIEVIRKILKYFNKDDSYIEYVKDRPGHDRKYSLDWNKIHKNLGWRPLFDFDTWLEKTIEWYKKNETWWKKFKGKNFQKYYKSQYTDQ